MNNEDIKVLVENFEELKAFKEHIGNIDKDFFFNFADYLIARNKELKYWYDFYKEQLTFDSIPKSKVREIIDKYLKNTKLNPNGYCLSFEGSQKVAKEILKLLQEGDDK